jgi:hypothetical protein
MYANSTDVQSHVVWLNVVPSTVNIFRNILTSCLNKCSLSVTSTILGISPFISPCPAPQQLPATHYPNSGLCIRRELVIALWEIHPLLL